MSAVYADYFAAVRCIYYVSSAGPVRALLTPSERDECTVRLQSLTRTRVALLHPRLVHHAYRCIALKAKFTLLNCATASVKRRRNSPGTRHLTVYLVAKSADASSQLRYLRASRASRVIRLNLFRTFESKDETNRRNRIDHS